MTKPIRVLGRVRCFDCGTSELPSQKAVNMASEKALSALTQLSTAFQRFSALLEWFAFQLKQLVFVLL